MRNFRIRRGVILKRVGIKALMTALDKFDAENNTLTTYRIKKLNISNNLVAQEFSAPDKCGILIQGPLFPNVTLRTCKWYRELYPQVTIVFSTWEQPENHELQEIRKLGVEVIKQTVPTSPGPSNVNMQIISTKLGLEYLKDAGVDLVLKNRSDGVLSSDCFLQYLMFLYRTFSVNGEKIVIPGYNSFLFRLYSPTDQFQFGSLKTLRRFWSCDFAEANDENFRFAESYLVRAYLSLLGRSATFTIEDSLSVYRDYFVIADNAELGLVLNKGTRSDVSNRWANDGFPQGYSELHFWSWLDLSSDSAKYVKLYQELTNKPNF
jgi:hypothetical protein